MPLYHSECPDCGKVERLLLTSRDPEALATCTCGGKPQFVTAGSTQTRVMEVLDNGVMPRRVERPVNAEELQKDHSTAPPKSDTLV